MTLMVAHMKVVMDEVNNYVFVVFVQMRNKCEHFPSIN